MPRRYFTSEATTTTTKNNSSKNKKQKPSENTEKRKRKTHSSLAASLRLRRGESPEYKHQQSMVIAASCPTPLRMAMTDEYKLRRDIDARFKEAVRSSVIYFFIPFGRFISFLGPHPGLCEVSLYRDFTETHTHVPANLSLAAKVSQNGG